MAKLNKVRAVLLPFFLKMIHNSLEDYSFTMGRYISFRVEGVKALRKVRIPFPKYVLDYVSNKVTDDYIELSKNEELIKEKLKFNERKSLGKRLLTLKSIYLLLSLEGPEGKDRGKLESILERSGIRGENLEKRLIAEIKALDVRLMESKEEVKEVKPVTKSDFMGIFSFLAKEGYPMSLDMPVLQYIETINVFNQDQNRLKKLKNNLSNGRLSNR